MLLNAAILINLAVFATAFNFQDFISLAMPKKLDLGGTNNTSENITDSTIKLPKYDHINKVPVIGVLTHPMDDFNLTAIEANYIYWLNSGGADLIAISSNSTREEIDYLFDNINGVVIPDRYEPLDLQSEPIIQYLITKVIETNKKSYMPLMGIGSAANLIIATIANDFNLFDYIEDSYNVMRNVKPAISPLEITLLKHFDGRTYDSYINQNTTVHFVKDGINPENFLNNSLLNTTLKLTGISTNPSNKSYVSMFEGLNGLPIYGLIHHPEKMPWEKDIDPNSLSYTSHSITISQKLLNFFVNQCRKNPNMLGSKIEFINPKEFLPLKRQGRYYFYFGIDSGSKNGLRFVQPENLKVLENIPIKNHNLRQNTYISVSMKEI
jgi:hypothetical protein